MESAYRRTSIITRHIVPSPCLNYSPPSDQIQFNPDDLRLILDGHDLAARDMLFRLMEQSSLFCPRRRGDRVFVGPDYNDSKEKQREITMERIGYLLQNGIFEGWLTKSGEEIELRKMALNEVIGLFDHSLAIKLGVHFFLWLVF